MVPELETCDECYLAATRHGGGLMAVPVDGVRHWASVPPRPRTKTAKAEAERMTRWSFCGEVPVVQPVR